MAGLALVAVSATGPGAGAVLSDTAEHLRTSLKPMLAKLQSVAASKSGSAGAQTAIANASGDAAPPAASSTAKPGTAPAANSAAPATAAATAPLKPSAPAQKLTQTTFPDNSGSVGLPAGWKITAAREGDVSADGPNGEKMRFGMAQSAIDYSNPQSRVLGRGPGGTAPGNFVAIPFGTPGDEAFKQVITQLSQKQHIPVPTLNYAIDTTLPSQGGSKNYFLQGTTHHSRRTGPDLDRSDGRRDGSGRGVADQSVPDHRTAGPMPIRKPTPWPACSAPIRPTMR